MKNIITQIGEGAGGELYQAARQARAQLAKEFEDVYRVDKLLGTKAGYADRQVALDDVFKYVVLDGSLEEMRTVTKLLKKGGKEGQQAYKELTAFTLQQMKDLLLKKVMTQMTFV
jgi:transcription elongation factor GreA-like protein